MRLHYDRRGLADEVGLGGEVRLANAVEPIRLRSGWLLASDATSKSLLAFREESARVVLDDDGKPRELAYRSPAGPGSANFGRGDGLLASVVITGEAMAEELGAPAAPPVARLFELEENKVLVFFPAASMVRAIHLLELEEVADVRDFDLDADPASGFDRLEVRVLRGRFQRFPGAPAGAFLSLREVAERVTGHAEVEINSFQPIGLPGRDAALLLERTSSTLVALGARRDPVSGEILRGDVHAAATPAHIFATLQSAACGRLVDPPFDLGGAFPHRLTREVCIYVGGTLLALDPLKAPHESLRVLLAPADFAGVVSWGSPAGGGLVFAAGESPGGRLAFDRGRALLLQADYVAGTVRRVVGREALAAVTGSPEVDVAYIEPFSDREVRLLDRTTTSLLRLKMR